MNKLVSDLNYATRTLTRRPGFALIVTLTYALGVGATTTIFSVMRNVLIKPLPYPNSEQLVQLWETKGDISERAFSVPNYVSLRERSRSLAGVAAYIFADFSNVTLSGGDGLPERIPGTLVSANAFEVLGVPPAMGRTFLPEEIELGNANVVILGHELWQTRFAGASDILGTVLTLNGATHTVVGVMPPGFRFPAASNARLWRPLRFFDAWKNNRGNHLLRVFGRLEPRVSFAEASIEVQDLGASLAAEFPETNEGEGMRAVPLLEQTVGNVRTSFYVLMSAVVLLWLVVSANVANLFITRILDRDRELAVRRALGADGWALARLVLTESGLLSIVGGILGIVLAVAGIRAVIMFGPSDIPRIGEVTLDVQALMFGLVVTGLSALASGILPMATMNSSNLASLGQGASRVTVGRSARRTRDVLIGAESALAVVLLIAAGLLVQSFAGLMKVAPGFDTQGILTAEINLPFSKYRSASDRIAFYRRLMPELEAVPGVVSASAISVFPLTGNPGGATSLVADDAPSNADAIDDVGHRVTLPRYFQTVDVPLVAGRYFIESDNDADPTRVIINEELARLLWPTGNPVGRLMNNGGSGDRTGQYEVVGVVADVKESSLAAPAKPVMYLPYPQFALRDMVLTVRTATDPEGFVSNLRAVVSSIDAERALESIQTAGGIVGRSVARPRFNMLLLSLFAAVALVLSAVGVYGVAAQAVTTRTPELALRIALGASSSSIVLLVLRQGLLPIVGGVVFGLVGAYAGARSVASLVFGVTVHDPVTYGGGALLMLVVASIGTLVPALHAARVDAVTALASE